VLASLDPVCIPEYTKRAGSIQRVLLSMETAVSRGKAERVRYFTGIACPPWYRAWRFASGDSLAAELARYLQVKLRQAGEKQRDCGNCRLTEDTLNLGEMRVAPVGFRALEKL
jgi:hypothetical protein